MSGLELCPKCKRGHLYPIVTASVNTQPEDQLIEPASRDYECAICGHKQMGLKPTKRVYEKAKASIRAKKEKDKTKDKDEKSEEKIKLVF